MVYAPDRKSGHPGSLPGFSTALMVSWPNGKGIGCKRIVYRFDSCTGLVLFSHGATAARLILVQEIVVQFDVGKLVFRSGHLRAFLAWIGVGEVV